MNAKTLRLGDRGLIGASGLVLTAVLASLAGQANAQVASDEIVVTGQRASDRDSLLRKRDANSQVEVVSANDVGKLPDQNVAESVRRLTGVSVATDKGEGRYLIIRGIEPNLANVTINNQTASAPEPENRNVKLDDIPSAMIGSVTVVKSLTPDRDANAIAGQVDINTLNAFDKGRTFANARVVGGFYEDTDREAKEGDAAIGGVFGADKQFGAVFALNYSKRPSYSEDVLSTSRQLVSGFDLPAEMDQRIYDPAYRTRQGAVANFDFRPTPDAKLYFRAMYSEFGDRETRNRFRFFFPGTAAGYSTLNASGGTISATTARRLLRKREEVTDTTTLSTGGDFRFSGGEIKVELTHAHSNKQDPIRDEVEYRAAAGSGVTALGASFVNGDELLSSFTANAAALNPANYRLNNYKQVSRQAGEKLDQFRVDYTRPFGDAGDSSFKIGAKYLVRNRFQDQTGRTFTATGAAATRTLAADAGPDGGLIFDGGYTFGPTTSMDSAQAYVFANNTNTSLFTVNAADQVSQSKTSDYEVREAVTAGYIMADFKAGALTVIPGVRVEKTDGDTKAIIYRAGVTTLASGFDSFGSYSYTDYFPGVNAKYEFTDHLLARAAVTTAIGRPSFVNLAPTVTVDTGSNTVSRGNPNLEPQKAVNFDASLEYYFEDEGGVSIAFFHKRIEDPVFATSALNQTGVFGGVALTNATVNSFANGEKAELSGVELAFQKPFTFLPSPFDGFGINANMTFTDGKLDVPGRTVDTPMVGQADKIASVQVYYEKYGISGRVAYTYHSDYLDTDGGLNVADVTGNSDGYFGELSTIDAKLAYRFPKGVELFVEGNNLTDAEDYYFFRSPNRFREGEKYGRSMRVGLSYTY